MLLLLLLVGWCAGEYHEFNYGYLPRCPGMMRPMEVTPGGADVGMFAVLEVHQPATERSAGYLHRRRFAMTRAGRGIGQDPEVDLKRRKTMVFMDGYMDSTHGFSVRFLAGNFAAMGYNTISIDAQKLYSFTFPITARTTYQVGNYTAMMLQELMSYGLRARDIELVGISLGGQIVSLVAKNFIRLTGQKVGRIFSMDPGGPCFRGTPKYYHLSPDDADMVQAIHTGNDGFGMADAQGHVDFYINGGEFQFFLNPYQPWCEDLYSHLLSTVYLYSSLLIFPDEFVGIRCKSVQQAREHKCYENEPYVTNVMGFKTDYSKPGIYYVPMKADGTLFVGGDWMKTKPIFPLIYNDAYSSIDNFELANRSIDRIEAVAATVLG